MEGKLLFVCLFVCLAVGCVYGQVSSICRPNERLLQCGCPKTCSDPVPDCKGVCKEGCFCEENQVRNAEGLCVNLDQCPSTGAPYKQDTSEPRVNGGDCPEDQEYRYCEPCNRSCASPNPVCPAQCARGCFCKDGLLKDKDGSCVEWTQCSNYQAFIEEREKNIVQFKEPPARFSCGPGKVYKSCEKCVKFCGKPVYCDSQCRAGCMCKDGLVKGPGGRCINEEECPESL